MSVYLLHDFADQSESHLDVWGISLSSIGLFSLLYGLTNVSSHGWSSRSVYPFLVAGLLLLIILVVVELRIKNPLIEFRVLKDYLAVNERRYHITRSVNDVRELVFTATVL